MKKRISFLLAICFFVLSGCNNTKSNQQDHSQPSSISTEEGVSIACLAPAYTRTLLDFGMEKQLVLVDENSATLSEYRLDLPTVDMLHPNMEVLLSVQPQILIASDMTLFENPELFAPLEKQGCNVIIFSTPSSIDEIITDIRSLGTQLGVEEKGNQVADSLEVFVQERRELVAAMDHQPTVYFEISPFPDGYAVGSAGFQNELIALAGGKNVITTEEEWIPVTEEAIIQANPEIIFSTASFLENAVPEILGRPGWTKVPAVQNGYVFLLDVDNVSQGTSHIQDGILEMASYIQLLLKEEAKNVA